MLVLSGPAVAAGSEHRGLVTVGGVPVPGATVTAVQGDTTIVTISEQDGSYRFTDLANGSWTVRVEMLGFSTATGDVSLPAADVQPRSWELRLLSFEEIARSTRLLAPASVEAPQTARDSRNPASSSPQAGRGFQRAGVTTAAPLPSPPNAFPEDANPDAAADGLLINGSVNNSAASLFAQPRAFGNTRPGQRSLYTGMLGLLSGHSAFDARPFSLTGEQAVKPSYFDAQALGTFGGPVKIPGVSNRANLFVGYQGSSEHNAVTQSALMPTLAERSGDFSQSRDGSGRSIQIVDPRTGLPFPGNVIPPGRISPQAKALLDYYPLPNSGGGSRFNYQTPIVTATRQDNVQTRVTLPVDGRNQLAANVAYQRTATDTLTLFGFQDEHTTAGLDAQANWFHRLNLFLSFRLRYQYTRLTTSATPYFANRTNVSGDAGIGGNNQDPENWGPPGLTFSSGVAGLSDALPAFNRSQTHAGSAEAYWRSGEHTFTFGGDARTNPIAILAQQDPRGTFAFTGAFTGADLADFLLGIPGTSSIASGNADKYFRSSSFDAYITDDWRLNPTATLNLGVRWEYEAPITESRGRLVNLDVASGFAAVAPVAAGSPTGPLTGNRFPSSLVSPDKTGFQPRLAMAWRPVPGSSLVVRAGYGLYRNTAVYQSIATLLAQQPPLSNAFSVENSVANPLTLADGFKPRAGTVSNTFAVDPGFRVSSAHNWQVSVQRDLPASLTVNASYLGSRGTRLMQEFLPNTYPAGAVNPCPACPAGFVYLTSNGTSLRNAGQVQLRRRLRNGLGATVQYTLAKATDNAAAFGGASLTGASIAQDWVDLEAERSRSSFDQRHLVTAQMQYTTGAGVTGGTLIDGMKGQLLKDWTFAADLSTGSGLPLTPIYLTQIQGTGVVGTIRAARTAASADAVPEGYFLNPLAYATPAPGQWGDAGRNSATGPRTFSLDASIARTFRWGDRINIDWRIDATNVLNQVTYSGVNTLVTSPQFGLPNRTNSMRRLRSSLRVRF